MKKIVASGMIGNALEWYDYALYAQFVDMIAKHFIAETEFAQLLAMAFFAIGFLMRPVGAIVFGYIGDKYGRRIALTIGILTMALPTALIGMLPSYATIGIWATVLLGLLRIVQGFALGGEFSGCISYIVEHAPPESRGLAGSAAFVSMAIGMLIGTLTGVGMSLIMSEEALFSWGWRIPFILGLFIGLVGLYIRYSLPETPVFIKAKESGGLSKEPVRETLTYYMFPLLVAVGIYINVTTPFYVSSVYVETFMNDLGYTRGQSGFVSILILVTMIIVFPISAKLSDKWGRKKTHTIGAILIIVTAYPMLAALGDIDIIAASLSQVIFAAAIAFYMGPMPATLVEMFPTKIRFTALGISYNISAAIFGGTAPMVALLLQEWTGNQYAIGIYTSVLAIISFVILRKYLEETHHSSVNDGEIV
jgi:MFS transporter, MHS family, proline/betaine transporter